MTKRANIKLMLLVLNCILLSACTMQTGGVKNTDSLQLELPYWNWKFHISDEWVVQQQSYLFNMKQDVGEENFRQLLKSHRDSLFTLTANTQRQHAPDALTLVTSILPLRGQAKPTTEWLSEQIHYLSQAYADFQIEQEPVWTSGEQFWAKARFSFVDPGLENPVRVQSVFLATIDNDMGVIVAIANPSSEPLTERALLDSINKMVDIPDRKIY